MAFSMYKRLRKPSCGSSLSMCAVMRSIPGALCGFNGLISVLGSLRVKACRFTNGWVGDASSFSILGSCVSSCGVNTPERCFAKSSSLSLFAHGPGGVELAQIGGSDICGFFLDLIGFKKEWSSLLRVET